MKRIYSIFEAKARLSEIIRTVRINQEVIITDRGNPVVKVVPYRIQSEKSLQDRVGSLSRMGAVSAARPYSRPIQTPVEKNLLKDFLKNRD